MPPFLIRELARQEDVEQISTKKPALSLTDRKRMGPNARARCNTKETINYKVDEILHNAKQNTAHLPKLDKKKAQRVKEIELNHYLRHYCKSKRQGQSDLPDYLQPFVEPPTMEDVKKLAKDILDDTYDFKKDDDWMHTIVYRNLPQHERANYRAKYLKHLSLNYLEERDQKRKIQEEKMLKEIKVKQEKK